jgi:hypothetical protein
MASGTRRGGRPVFLSFGLGKLGRGPRCGAFRLATALAVATLMAADGLAAEALKAPAGMVPYSQPVFRNGKRLLWHGAWRGNPGRVARRYERPPAGPARLGAVTALAPQTTAPAPQTTASIPQQPAPKEFSILADPADARASRMARDFAAAMGESGAPGRAIVGSTSPNGLGKVAKTDMADFAIVSLDSLVATAKGDPDWIKRAPFVARLGPETLEVIAPREIKSINDLQGKMVSFGDVDSATSTSGRMLFARLGVTPNQTNGPLPEALDALASGKIDAVVVLGGEGSPALNDFGGDGRFHVVAIPWSATLEPVYAPAHVTAAERPNLVGATTPVETLGEPMALIALDAPPGSARADALGRLARLFFDNYDAFLGDDRDPHWREVNLAVDASLPGEPWPRLAAAQTWLDAKKASADASLDAFRASAKSASASPSWPSAADSERLYDGLTRWRGLMQ